MCGSSEPPHFPLGGRSQEVQPVESPMGFGEIPRCGLGHGCLPVQGSCLGSAPWNQTEPTWGCAEQGWHLPGPICYKPESRGWQHRETHSSLESQCEKQAIVGICCPLAEFFTVQIFCELQEQCSARVPQHSKVCIFHLFFCQSCRSAVLQPPWDPPGKPEVHVDPRHGLV